MQLTRTTSTTYAEVAGADLDLLDEAKWAASEAERGRNKRNKKRGGAYARLCLETFGFRLDEAARTSEAKKTSKTARAPEDEWTFESAIICGTKGASEAKSDSKPKTIAEVKKSKKLTKKRGGRKNKRNRSPPHGLPSSFEMPPRFLRTTSESSSSEASIPDSLFSSGSWPTPSESSPTSMTSTSPFWRTTSGSTSPTSSTDSLPEPCTSHLKSSVDSKNSAASSFPASNTLSVLTSLTSSATSSPLTCTSYLTSSAASSTSTPITSFPDSCSASPASSTASTTSTTSTGFVPQHPAQRRSNREYKLSPIFDVDCYRGESTVQPPLPQFMELDDLVRAMTDISVFTEFRCRMERSAEAWSVVYPLSGRSNI